MPRDTYVGEGYTGKLNEVYNHYGDKPSIDNLNKMIYEQFKLPVDYYATINFDGVTKIVDDIGGIPINMPYSINYTTYGKEVNIPEGESVLQGWEALGLLRARKGSGVEGDGSDTARVSRQRLFFAAAMKKVKDMGISEVLKVLPTASKSIDTYMTVGEMSDLAKIFIKIDMNKIKFYSCPGEGANHYYEGVNYSFYSLHKQATADMLNKYFRPFQGKVSADDLGIIELVSSENYKTTKIENTQDDLQSLLDGAKPGQKKDETTKSDSSSDE
jgi:LCP family protein required for cell wall assembly